MPALPELIKEYRAVAAEQAMLEKRKKELREIILNEMSKLKVEHFQSTFGSARQSLRFSLHPKRDEVLNLLKAEDLFPFATFTPKQVKIRLVPKYGREALLPLFDIERKPCLLIKAPWKPDQAQEQNASEDA